MFHTVIINVSHSYNDIIHWRVKRILFHSPSNHLTTSSLDSSLFALVAALQNTLDRYPARDSTVFLLPLELVFFWKRIPGWVNHG